MTEAQKHNENVLNNLKSLRTRRCPYPCVIIFAFQEEKKL